MSESSPGLVQRLRRWARELKRDIVAVHLAARDPRTPIVAKLAAVIVVAYALSPIDLIPDFIPVLGHLDDLVLVPLGIYLTIKLIPPELWAEYRSKADSMTRLPHSRWAGVVIFAIWIVALSAIASWLHRALG